MTTPCSSKDCPYGHETYDQGRGGPCLNCLDDNRQANEEMEAEPLDDVGLL